MCTSSRGANAARPTPPRWRASPPQGAEIPCHDEPDRLEIHFKVVVHQRVSHAGYGRPGDFGMPLLVRLGNPLRRLAENLKIANDCILECPRGKDRIPAGCGILADSANALDDMLDVRALGFHKGTDSRRTASRIRGLNERRITTWTRRPRSCSRSAVKLPGNHGVVLAVMSTSRSTSLSGVSSPRATEPKRRTFRAPWRAAMRKISSRCAVMR